MPFPRRERKKNLNISAVSQTLLQTFFRKKIVYPFAAEVQGCQMVYFQTKNSNLGKLWRVLQWMLDYVMDIWSIFRPFYYILGPFGYNLYPPVLEKYGNPAEVAGEREKKSKRLEEKKSFFKAQRSQGDQKSL
jgi:hypothetical protein